MKDNENNTGENIKEKIKQEKQKKEENVKSNNSSKETKQNEDVIKLSSKEFNDIKLQVAKALNDYKELEQDFDNYRKRTKESIDSAKVEGITKALESVLPALDTFSKARKLVKDEASLSGFDMVEKSIVLALNKLGVERIESVGKPFNPKLHNAVLMMEDKTKKSGTVIEELEMGYKMGETILKYSQVVVAK